VPRGNWGARVSGPRPRKADVPDDISIAPYYTNADDLYAAWIERHRRYAQNLHRLVPEVLTPQQIATVRAYRSNEANHVQPARRAAAWQRAQLFGGLKVGR